MEKLYIIFDQLPTITSGGLIVSYINLVELLKDKYDIQIISIFNYSKENDQIFPNNKIIHLSCMNIDNRFYRLLSYLKKGNVLKFLHAIFSVFYFFVYIPIARMKIGRIIKDDDLVISSSPAASIFIHSSIEYILEIHTNFDYFWGKNKMGSLQTHLMSKPKLTIFKNQNDYIKGKELFPSAYIYNFVNKNDVLPQNIDFQKRKNRILFVGRFHEHKNPLRLIECAKLLKNYLPDFQLDLYGDGVLKDKLENAIKENHLEDNVHLCGYTSNKNIYDEYSLLWLTSNKEGFGLVIVEAKSCIHLICI